MPECYTHVHIATQALMRSGNTVASYPAFMAGACGPDVLYMYRAWKARPKPDLPQLAERMHREQTGDFLCALVQNATTPAQQSYVLGFVTHYTTDCTLAPYIAAMSQDGYPYAGRGGQRELEAALDSHIYYSIFHTRFVPLHAATPVLVTDALAQVATLLQAALGEVYGLNIPLIALADAFHDNLIVRRWLADRTGVRRPLVGIVDARRPGRPGGPIGLCRQPAKRLRRLLPSWTNPYNQKAMTLSLQDLLRLAERTGAICITAAMRFWLGTLDADKLADVLGDNDYRSGLPCRPDTAAQDDGGARTQTA